MRYGSKVKGGQLTEEVIVKAAVQHFEKTGKWPTNEDRTSKIPLLLGDNWAAIDSAGKRGGRGLEKGRTLAKILEPIKERYAKG